MKKKYVSSKVEWDYIGQLIDAINDWQIKHQVYNALVWYVIKANRYRIYEYILNMVNVVVPAALMFCNKYMSIDSFWGQFIIVMLGTFAAAAKSSSKLHEKRICYRSAAEAIKSEIIRYINHVEEYESEERDAIFVKKIDQIRKEENIHWIKIETTTEITDNQKNNSAVIKDEQTYD